MPSSRGQPVGLISGPRPTYPGPRAFAIGGVAVLVAVLGYRHFAQKDIEQRKETLLAEEKGIETSMGGEWLAFRDGIEAAIREAAERGPADERPLTSPWDFRSKDGLYVRMPTRDARQPLTLRKGIESSKRDGFVSCLMRPDPTKDAGAGFTEQPWNLFDAYRATRVFDDTWKESLKETSEDLRVRAIRDQFDRATRDDIPKARDIMKRAEFVLIVLDDEVEGMRSRVDGGAITTELLSGMAHPTRIVLHSLREHRTLGYTSASVDTGQRTVIVDPKSGSVQNVADPSVAGAMQRQSNNCALAEEARRFFRLPL